MAKTEKKTSIKDEIAQLKAELSSDFKPYIPSIIEFCESENYLGLPYQDNEINLWPMQRILLKAFFRGTPGNENIRLDDEEVEILRKLMLFKEEGEEPPQGGDVLDKYESNAIFRELVLVFGRGAGKDFFVGLLCAYEACRLLEVSGGDPHKYYNIGGGNPITILTMANAGEQAEIAFREIKDKIVRSKYFHDKIAPEGLEAKKIWLLTPADKKILRDGGKLAKKGSICVEVGHSNSDSLRGKSCYVIVLDEVAMFKQTGGSSSGDVIYMSMTPALNRFAVPMEQRGPYGEILRDKNGKPLVVYETDAQGRVIKLPNGQAKIKKRFDSKVFTISSPRGKEGILWKLYESAPKNPQLMLCKLPTWIVNPLAPEDSLREANQHMTEEQFRMEFGAEFSGLAGENFFSRDQVLACFKHGARMRSTGQLPWVYFAHLDPARNSSNYALVVLHREYFLNPKTTEMDFKIVVDHIKHWHPLPNKPIDLDEIDEYMLALRKRFPLGLVTYDSWGSAQSIKKLQKNGIPAKETPFTGTYKMQIYSNLKVLVEQGKLIIPPYDLLQREMVHLQCKRRDFGFRIYHKEEGECVTDDVVDCLAGACFLSIAADVNKLPSGRLVNTGVVPTSNQRVWRSMQGVPYGYGTGQQVSRALERINSWPNWKR